jgi:predicted  nucleic acid-binding Zn-ribbon protein
VSFNGILLRFIRFRGTKKPDAEFKFTPGLNVLWGASDTGKTFLVESIDFMLGSGDQLKDIPERQGYETVELGLTTAKAKDYTLVRSIQGGNFLRFDGLLNGVKPNPKDAVRLAATHSSTKTTNLSRWLLQEIDLDQKRILYSKETGELRNLGFRALAHLCVITAQDISKSSSPIDGVQYTDRTRDYGVFKLLLTGVDDSAVIDVPKSPRLDGASVEPEVLKQMLAYYEEELAKLTDEPEELNATDTKIQKQLDEVQSSLAAMESQLADTTKERREVFARYSSLTSRAGEIGELLARFKLLDQQYSTDLKRLTAIEETGRYFILLTINTCPLCGATSEHQKNDTDCDGNVAAVTQAATAEIAKIELLQKELHDTVSVLTKENAAIAIERTQLEKDLRQLQKNIDAALSPEFSQARKTYSNLIEQRSSVRNALSVYSRVTETKAKIAKNGSHKSVKEADEDEAPVVQYLPKSALDDFSDVVQSILQAWHFPNATKTYFDEGKHDLVIGGKPRGSRGRGLCAITHSAFTIGLLDYCREHQMPHPGFVVLDSPLLAYKEPQGDDENIAGTDLKQRFYEHLIEFIGNEQLFIVENTEPPSDVLKTINHETFTGNPNEGRYGLFPAVVKKPSPRGST